MVINIFHQRSSLHFVSLHLTSFHFTSLNFISLHFTSIYSPLFTSLHFWAFYHHAQNPFTSLHFTSLHFTSLHFTSRIITFLNPFLKIYIQEKVASVSAGSWFRNLMVLFTKEYFLIFVLCSLALIFRSSSYLMK